MPGRLNESSRNLVSMLEIGGAGDISLNRRWSSPIRRRSPDRSSLRSSSASDLMDPLGLVALFSQYPSTTESETQEPLEAADTAEAVDPLLFRNGSATLGSSDTESTGLYTSLASSLNLLRRREMRLREMRARVDGMAERLALMREIRSIARRTSPARASSSSASSSTAAPSESMTWPSNAVRNALRGTWLASGAFIDANGDNWLDDKTSPDQDEFPDSQHNTSHRIFANGIGPLSPSMLSSYRIIDGVLFNLDGEQVGHVSALNSDLRSCKELYDEMAMHNLFSRNRNEDGSLYLYSTIAHNETNQKRRKHSVDLCAER
ncbi:hypothetical protein PORY_000791 [Pneumocystis oryctolagi]|uniref:Uncharacterized protein n=1 Tax=Pneumocystis oryctolagi TaxID=42067 RepID=A0ACB7CDM9_9ASCO|nr:hypothetical protein PORY_000791 [Pneumocystis oryctolagi]